MKRLAATGLSGDHPENNDRGPRDSVTPTRLLHISGVPESRDVARHWISSGIELTVMDSVTNLPIEESNGTFDVVLTRGVVTATIVNRIITRVD